MWINYEILEMQPGMKAEQLASLQPTGVHLGTTDDAELLCQYTNEMKEVERNCVDLLRAIKESPNLLERVQEIQYNLHLEGVIISMQDVHNICDLLAVDKNDTAQVLANNLRAISITLFLHRYNPQNQELISNMWDTLTGELHTAPKTEGKLYRTTDICVGNVLGVPPEKIEPAMDGLLDWLNSSKEDMRPIYKIALLHYAFRRISPFPDFNGVMSRVLMLDGLIRKFSNTFEYISPSTEIAHDSTDYAYACSNSSNAYNDCTPFITYMMKSINRTLARVYIQQQTGCSLTRYNTLVPTMQLLKKDDCDIYIISNKELLCGGSGTT